jgi:hypothetical protein
MSLLPYVLLLPWYSVLPQVQSTGASQTLSEIVSQNKSFLLQVDFLRYFVTVTEIWLTLLPFSLLFSPLLHSCFLHPSMPWKDLKNSCWRYKIFSQRYSTRCWALGYTGSGQILLQEFTKRHTGQWCKWKWKWVEPASLKAKELIHEHCTQRAWFLPMGVLLYTLKPPCMWTGIEQLSKWIVDSRRCCWNGIA